jgi:sugar-phosphatase
VNDSSLQGLLADLDGVLVDSYEAVARTWRWWAARHGIDPAPFIDSHGRPTQETIAELAPCLDAVAEAAVIEERESIDTADVAALPGAAELLSTGRQVAVVTSGTRALALGRLGAAGLPVPEVLVTAESVRRGKPDPEPYLLAAAQVGVEPANCTVFEDAPAGIAAGKAAGMRVVAVTTTFPAAELTRADVVVPDLAAYLAQATRFRS